MRLLLDDHLSEDVAAGLRNLGHDAQTTRALSLHELRDDERLWHEAISRGQIMVTYDKDDFPVLYGKLQSEGISHPGLILISSRTVAQHDRSGQVKSIHRTLLRYPVMTDLMVWALPPDGP
jgi:predicted nuclease of predicted toxin-antitoxin system